MQPQDVVVALKVENTFSMWLSSEKLVAPKRDNIQLSEAKGIFKGKERKALTEQIQQTEREISERLDKLPDILREDGYPDVQAFMVTYREAEAIVEQYNRDLAEWERQVKQKSRPPKPPERESVRNRLRQLQEQGRQQKPRKKSFDRDSR